QQVAYLGYEPVRSRTGFSILNPHCEVDYKSKMWNDTIGGIKNQFFQHYAAQISESCLPSELISPSVDYLLGSVQRQTISYCFVIDTVLYEEELEQLKDTLLQLIGLLPADANVALITFGVNVEVYMLGFDKCIKTFTFKGTSEIATRDMIAQLKLYHAGRVSGPDGRYVCRLANVEELLTAVLENLSVQNWCVAQDKRPPRCTGTAISAAIGLFEALLHDSPCRIMLFIGGICTRGAGAVVAPEVAVPIRQHQHLAKSGAELKQFKQAQSYYAALAQRAVAAGQAIDLFCCALDQTGLAEMRSLSERTGGICVMTDSFSMNVFRESVKELMKEDGVHYAYAYNVNLKVICSKEVAIAGALGVVTSLKKSSNFVDSVEVGEGGTFEWATGVMHPSTTVAFYFSSLANNASAVAGRQATVQFQCQYNTPTGERRLRVHTVTYPFANAGLAQLGPAFDQQTATLAMARLAVHRSDSEGMLDTFRWLDRKLIRVSTIFGNYQKGVPESFRLPQEFVYYPTFMYHFRRGPFIEMLNNSPDETAFYRLCLLRENIRNTITMIGPTLIMYNLEDCAPHPVSLDSLSLKPDCVLLMDSYFHVVLWHGQAIMRWREQRFHEQPEYQNLKMILEAPVADALALLKSKLPCPKFVSCAAGGSQERFILARVNPSVAVKGLAEDAEQQAGAILTEEVSLVTFIQHLAKFVTRI
uniref:Protein transport protein SEC23 n=1 Tax=Dermatophagoides pteronyssinus TaxID=6956 RepID=A0A6P6YMA7_DERPT